LTADHYKKHIKG